MPRVNLGSPSALKWQIGFYFDLYCDSLSSQVELADRAFEEWNRWIEEEARKYEEDLQAEFRESHSDEYTSRDYSKTIILNSFFVSAYALYEHHRNRVISRYSITKQRPKGSKLENSSGYKEIKHYKRIRNSIMHHGGAISNCSKETNYAYGKGIVADYFPPGQGNRI